jgi:hypothetical protein
LGHLYRLFIRRRHHDQRRLRLPQLKRLAGQRRRLPQRDRLVAQRTPTRRRRDEQQQQPRQP